MIAYDFRFNNALFQSFIGKKFSRYVHAKFLSTYTESVTGLLAFQVDNKTYELTNWFEKLDYLTLDGEATIFRIFNIDFDQVIQSLNNSICDNSVEEKISKIILVNDHATLEVDNILEYDIWETKAIIFYLDTQEICFTKQNCWFSQEIEICNGNDLINKIPDGKEIIEDFEASETEILKVNREYVTIE